jgi:hypothetical protein
MWDDTRRRILVPSSFVVFGFGFMLAFLSGCSRLPAELPRIVRVYPYDKYTAFFL